MATKGLSFAAMGVFLLILTSVPAATVLWWWWADRRLRTMRRGRAWRGVVAGFSLLFLACYAVIVGGRLLGVRVDVPAWLVGVLLLWAVLALPLIAVPMMTGWGVWRVVQALWARGRRLKPPAPVAETAGAGLSRRDVLGAALVTLPVAGTLGAAAYSIPQKQRLRVRDLTVRLPGLPAALDGATIAHVSDTHVGRFTHGAMLDRVVRQTNELRADLVLFTGDLLDASTRDLPEALRMMERLTAGSGLFLVEGNHDLFDGREAFERGVRGAGLPLLLDEAATVTVRGERVQLLGTRWPGRTQPMDAQVDFVAQLRDPRAFPILLAHHPHAFDRAAALDIPLTLAGHTHGGQLMLTEAFGAGPAMFRYWSGLYTQRDSALVVSNGAGHWFPLRVNAPAEIVHVTLRRG